MTLSKEFLEKSHIENRLFQSPQLLNSVTQGLSVGSTDFYLQNGAETSVVPWRKKMKNWWQHTHTVVLKLPLCSARTVMEQDVREAGGGMRFG